MNDSLRAEVLRRVRAEYRGQGSVRAQLLERRRPAELQRRGPLHTVPNVKDDEKLIEAIKTVWASLWNFEAYEARERATSITRRSSWPC